MCFFKPASGMNQTSQALYEKNILSITRQVHYSLKNENSIDVVLFINGLASGNFGIEKSGDRSDRRKCKASVHERS